MLSVTWLAQQATWLRTLGNTAASWLWDRCARARPPDRIFGERARLQAAQAKLESLEVVGLQFAFASRDNLAAALHKSRGDLGVVDGDAHVGKRPHEPQAYGSIGGCVVAYLFEGEIEEAIELYPGHRQPQNMRRVVIEAARRDPTHPAYQDAR